MSDLAFDGRLESSPEIPWVFTHGGGALPLLSERIELLRGL
ncbi:MAG: putative hydrolase, partial [Modestobacter sp.]|nr:putative hydrolase [Modestobacter sp.]